MITKIRIIQYIGLIFILLSTIAVDGYTTNCNIDDRINSVKKSKYLEKLIKEWHNAGLLNIHCYFSIGKKYYSFFKQKREKSTLENAIKYLEYAANNLKRTDPKYPLCYKYLILSESYSTPPEVRKLINYNNHIPEDNLLKESNVRMNIEASIKQAKEKYINNPFKEIYPDNLVKDVDLLAQYGINIDLSKMITINNLVRDFNKYLLELKNNQSHNGMIKTYNVIKMLEDNGIVVPQSQALEELYQYYTTYSESIDLTYQQKCEKLGKSINHFRVAQKSFNYLRDHLHVECYHKFFCLLKDIQLKIQVLMPDGKHTDQYPLKLQKCTTYTTQFNSINNLCPTQTFNVPKQLLMMVQFYNVYIQLHQPHNPTPTNNIVQFMHRIDKNQNKYAIELYNLAGYHIADYYYQKTWSFCALRINANA
jgi:hypothetical protein